MISKEKFDQFKKSVEGSRTFSFFGGLKNFLKEYAVIGLAIGVIVAQVSKDLVDSLVKGLFMPFIKAIFSGRDFSKMTYEVNGAIFDIGSIISAFLTFIIVMAILYFVVKKIMKDDQTLEKIRPK